MATNQTIEQQYNVNITGNRMTFKEGYLQALQVESQSGDEVFIGDEIRQGKENGQIEKYKVFHKAGGDTTVRPVDPTGQELPNRNPIYKNGKWDQSEITPETINGAPNPEHLSEKKQKTHDIQIKNGVKRHAKTTGQVVPTYTNEINETDSIETTYNDFGSWKSNQVLDGEVAQNNNNQERNMWWNAIKSGFSKSAQGLLAIERQKYNMITPSGTGSGGQEQMENMSRHMQNSDDIMFKKIVKYPMDMSTSMDHTFFQCYSYQPPYAGALGGGPARESGQGVTRGTPFKKKLGAGIALPMPNNMLENNGREWAEENMNTQAMGAIQGSSKRAWTSMFTGDFFGWGGTMRKLSQQFDRVSQQSGRTDMMANHISQLAEKMGTQVSPEDILKRSVGVVHNSNTELLFTGVSLRSFDFQYSMTPRNELEAHNVRMILRAFKQWSAPRKLKRINSLGIRGAESGRAGAPSFFLGTPNIFRIRYVTEGNKNILGVNKFKPCALTNVTVNYTPEGKWMSYDGGMPISVSLSLRFQELEPIYNTDYSEDIARNRQHNPQNPNDVGDLMPIALIKQFDKKSSDVGY